MLKDRNWLPLINIAWKILNGFCILFSAFLLISILIAIYYLTAEPPDLACLMCVGCPCAYTDFILARDYYLNFLFPWLIAFNTIFLSISIILIAILKHKYDTLKLSIIRKI
ncbi:MAG: hypothetical protein ACFE8G_08970 [Candidatus Hermodarchaeota archaeon]